MINVPPLPLMPGPDFAIYLFMKKPAFFNWNSTGPYTGTGSMVDFSAAPAVGNDTRLVLDKDGNVTIYLGKNNSAKVVMK